MRNTDTQQEEELKRLREEIAMLGRMNHPNIVRCLGATQHETHINIFIEWMAGERVGRVWEGGEGWGRVREWGRVGVGRVGEGGGGWGRRVRGWGRMGEEGERVGKGRVHCAMCQSSQ